MTHESVHPLLLRLLRKGGAAACEPPSREAWQALVALISQTFHEADQDRYTLERSIELSSREMQGLYQDLKQRSETAEAALAQLHEHAQLLREQNEQLRQLEERLRRTSALVVHDLKGPTTAIFYNAECLRDAADVSPQDREMVDDILTAVSHLQRTVYDLLDVARADDGVLRANAEPFDLAELATCVAAVLRGVARDSQVQIAIDVRVPHLVADREMVRRMLENLVYNAVRYAPAGSSVTIQADVAGDAAVMLRVNDTGPGVPPSEVERIFEQYVLLDGERGPRAGHGLGLAFCRLAAAAHGGRIWVENRQPQGASFCVRFPAQGESRASSAA